MRRVNAGALTVALLEGGCAEPAAAAVEACIDAGSDMGCFLLRWLHRTGASDIPDGSGGGPAISDPVELELAPLTHLAVSLHLPMATPVDTFHSLGVQTSCISSPGDLTGATNLPVA
jgi:hypothetical protein